MSTGDLGIWMGVIVAPIPAMEVYQEYGLLAAIGTFFVAIYVLGFSIGLFLGLMFRR